MIEYTKTRNNKIFFRSGNSQLWYELRGSFGSNVHKMYYKLNYMLNTNNNAFKEYVNKNKHISIKDFDDSLIDTSVITDAFDKVNRNTKYSCDYIFILREIFDFDDNTFFDVLSLLLYNLDYTQSLNVIRARNIFTTNYFLANLIDSMFQNNIDYTDSRFKLYHFSKANFYDANQIRNVAHLKRDYAAERVVKHMKSFIDMYSFYNTRDINIYDNTNVNLSEYLNYDSTELLKELLYIIES